MRRQLGLLRTRLSVAARPVGRALRTLTPAGRAVLVLTVVCGVVGRVLGWTEMTVLAAAGGLLLLATALFMLGRTQLGVRLVVEPPRVTVGGAVTGSLGVANLAKTPMLPVTLELPVGAGGAAFAVPALRPGGRWEEVFLVPTERRGVIPVGPVTSVRGDPVGLFRRDQLWSEVTEVVVHPRVVELEALGSGLIRDLEGTTSDWMSASDLAFHALREYTPGDDLRHVHWKSTARHGSMGEDLYGSMLVRQYVDTRRSHVTVVVDGRPESYRFPSSYETAVSVGGSLLRRADRDEYDTTFCSGDQEATMVTGPRVLDVCSRAEPGPDPVNAVALHASRLAPGTSFLFLVTGPHCDFTELQRAADQFPPDVGRVAVRVDEEARPSLRSAGGLSLLTLTRLEELPGLMRWATS